VTLVSGRRDHRAPLIIRTVISGRFAPKHTLRMTDPPAARYRRWPSQKGTNVPTRHTIVGSLNRVYETPRPKGFSKHLQVN